ncbi:4-hydroxybenzoate polyprenyl transferase [Wallemia mellicola]|uniref:4-hydroxybenzoate polyprenyltransferase, mitochondrial n=1 Tax=Wallemia mellicola TaxID=1708541 RepID=A0A4V4N0P5_9BASI|nr:hypothetical protein E3Q24_00855 [Wallemia mellicola]TIB90968.1 4-hydroxybenzoate polyprenyl transferase [Wallemia mellicola]TIB92661.1 4-hydroxybenzoate polyprenyl transferase [Wallemia mellicola]TIB99755.1 4-hydroxybenzoate polyprenyl transferase [Wallemia mellicola]TIC14706.1 4-hydroxybenzoate polyprenyl transferase [Wallemia mellicola]
MIRGFLGIARPQKCYRSSLLQNSNVLLNLRFNTTSTTAPAALPKESFVLRNLPAKWKPYFLLTRADRPIGTFLLFWPCAWSITLASSAVQATPTEMLKYLALFGTGSLIMRGAGCVINDLWDRRLDAAVERTKTRPLAAGDVTPANAIGFLGLQLSAGLGILTQLNLYSILLGASSLSLVTIYPFMKRITYWPQAVLGLAFNWGALLGYSAIAGSCAWQTVLPLYTGAFCWTIVYDTIYAHQDKTDDVHAGIKSTALLFGEQTKPVLTAFSGGFVGLLSAAGYAADATLPFYLLAPGGAAAHLAWQLKTVNLDSPSDCWLKFVSNSKLGGFIWLGTVADYVNRMGFLGSLF